MKRKIIVTGDNSKSLYIPEWDETYHSVHGARQESNHIFIQHGLAPLIQQRQDIHIFEVGFGTGLNALLSLAETFEKRINIIYDCAEKFPIEQTILNEIDFTQTDDLKDFKTAFQKMHQSNSGESIAVNSNFIFTKYIEDILNLRLKENFYNLIYFDAFAPKIQPELWTEEIMKKMFDSLQKGGTLVTYCAQGQFRRNLKNVGFTVERLPGPPGKREITRAIK